jgi:hypothetical protein
LPPSTLNTTLSCFLLAAFLRLLPSRAAGVLKSKRQMEIDKLNKGEATLQRAIAYRMNVEAPVATPATSPVQVTPATQVPVPVLKRNRRGKTVDPLAVAITNSPQLSSNSSPQQAKRIALSPIKVRQAPATSRVPLSPIKVPLQCVDGYNRMVLFKLT